MDNEFKEDQMEVGDEVLQDDDFHLSLHEEKDEPELKSVFGWIALFVSFFSFIFAPYAFAIAGIILGFIARTRNAVLLGNTAIVVGILSIIVRLVIMPFI